MISFSELKAKAKTALKKNYWKCVIAALILLLLLPGSDLSSNLSDDYDPVMIYQTDVYDEMTAPAFSLSLQLPSGLSIGRSISRPLQEADTGEVFYADVDVYADTYEESSYTSFNIGPLVLTFASWLLGLGYVLLIVLIILHIFVFNPILAGCRSFFLQNLNSEAHLSEITFAFPYYWLNISLGMLTTEIVSTLWYLLLIIPGIIHYYAYLLVPYLLAENPLMTGAEAREYSSQLMNGHKMDAFLFGLSFIGWDILSILTLGILGVFFVNPYKYSAYAAWYQEVKELQ